MNKIINPHDGFFRETFGRKEIAASFFQEYLPPQIVRQLDLREMEKNNRPILRRIFFRFQGVAMGA